LIIPKVRSDLVLLGGGHANIQVLRDFAMRPEEGLRVTLISDVPYAPYSGMLPGHLAGWYSFDEAHFDLQQICERAGARFILGRATGIRLEEKRILLEGRPEIDFDLLSINVGIQPVPLKTPTAPGPPNLMLVKPIGNLLESWTQMVAKIKSTPEDVKPKIVIAGGGAAGMEMAIVLRSYFEENKKNIDVTLVCKTPTLIPGQSRRAQWLAARWLKKNKIKVISGQKVLEFDGTSVVLSRDRIKADYVLGATGAQAPQWLTNTGLKLDEKGFLKVDQNLRALEQKDIFAGGDCIQFSNRNLPKAGVYAVRQGPILSENLRRRFLKKTKLKAYRPQKRTLFLVTTGQKRALASYGFLALESKWLWYWKNRIDRKFMTRFQTLPLMSEKPKKITSAKWTRNKKTKMLCGGCGSKLSPTRLHKVLDRLRSHEKFLLSPGLGKDDCSVEKVSAGKSLLHNVDAFRSLVDDPYLVGRLLVEHACNDVYAMGGVPVSTQALLALGSGHGKILERDCYQLLFGIAEGLSKAGVTLTGGHTLESLEPLYGLSLLGEVTSPIAKNTPEYGDTLILTKPIGCGAHFVAMKAGEARGSDLQSLYTHMLTNQKNALDILTKYRVHALTDVTGFGLGGHLLEMFKGTPLTANLNIPSIPQTVGFEELKVRAPLSSEIEDALKTHSSWQGPLPHVLIDPQTCGGLLASVPETEAQACIQTLHQEGYSEAAVIGNVGKNTSGFCLSYQGLEP